MRKRKTFNAIFFVLIIFTAVEPYFAKQHVLVKMEGRPEDFFMARTDVGRRTVPITIPDLTDLEDGCGGVRNWAKNIVIFEKQGVWR